VTCVSTFRIALILLAVAAVASAPAMAVEINKEFIQNWKVLVKGSPIHGAERCLARNPP
jgi:hypothetical protein